MLLLKTSKKCLSWIALYCKHQDCSVQFQEPFIGRWMLIFQLAVFKFKKEPQYHLAGWVFSLILNISKMLMNSCLKDGKRRSTSRKDMIFSGGPRSCIGKNLALTETKVMLIKLIKNFDTIIEHGVK